MIGIHPNTVRLYEKLGLITKPERRPNGYRVFTELHVDQFRLARIAFQIEVMQNGLRKMVVETVKASGGARGNGCAYKRKEASEHLGISADTLRNWEMNGLLTVKRRQNGYRVYTEEDMERLKIIRSLRCANYSLEAILRMLGQLSANPQADIREALDTPKPDAEISAVCDKLVTSLEGAERNAGRMLRLLLEMKAKLKLSLRGMDMLIFAICLPLAGKRLHYNDYQKAASRGFLRGRENFPPFSRGIILFPAREHKSRGN